MERTFRLNTTAATFPLLSIYFGRSTLTRQPDDSNYVITNSYSGTQADRDIGIPMPLYLQNVMPTTQGLSSVGFSQQAIALGGSTHRQAFILRTWDNSRFLFSPARGWSYLLNSSTKTWLPAGPAAQFKEGLVTRAYLHKKTYIFYQREALQLLNENTGQMESVAVDGLDLSFFDGVTSANNYLIFWNHDTIFWSSILDQPNNLSRPTAVPSLATSAGSETPIALRGAIVCCLPMENGFLVYTTKNVVSANYSGNLRFPWKFQEVANSGGIQSPEHVTYESTSEGYYNWTTAGLQIIGKGNSAQPVFPEISDFLTGHILEDYVGSSAGIDHSNISKVWSAESQTWPNYLEEANELIQFNHQQPLRIKLTLVENRWLVISYGLEETLQWALVYDSQLKRWGKLRITHTDCVELSTTSQTVSEREIYHTIGFLQIDGTVLTVSFEARTPGYQSVLIFGRLQHTRGKVITLHAMEIENGRPGEMELSVLTSLDGKNWLPGAPSLPQIQTRNLTKWLLRKTGINHSFKLTGTFDVVSIQGTCTIGGPR